MINGLVSILQLQKPICRDAKGIQSFSRIDRVFWEEILIREGEWGSLLLGGDIVPFPG